ncbi:MAG: alkaline phosphatase family protein [Actinomycetota bacterium]|jgi:hypothetical protein|nr:alkaline phosphatase family protein [Actinomycetota bacterium]
MTASRADAGNRPRQSTPTLDRALEILCSPELAPMVEMVVHSPEAGTYEVRSIDGRIRFSRDGGEPVGPDAGEADAGETAIGAQASRPRRASTPGRPVAPPPGDWRYTITGIDGRNPLHRQDPTWFSPLATEIAHRQPSREENSYPLAFERIAQLFDHPCAPDLCVLHTASHRPTAHRGEHGSLDVVQSRAPMVAAGPGIRRQGLVDGWCRVVDLAPTVLALMGAPTRTGIGPDGRVARDLHLARQDGKVLDHILDPTTGPADHVVVVLMDGANANVLYRAAAQGTMPHLGGLVERGTALAHGAVASLPTVTLANHTSLHTGCHPGHHGVLHNAWYDRSLGREVVTESAATWQESMQWLAPGIETIHEAVHRTRPGAFTASVNEPADRGSDYSTMELMRRGEVGRLMEDLPAQLPGADEASMAEFDEYRWGSLVDVSALRQAVSILEGSHLGADFDMPAFMWVSFSVTDAAFHCGGPYSEVAQHSLADTDARLGQLLEAIDRRGMLERTAIFVVADHGMEETAEDAPGDWGDVLRSAGIAHRDEASGFLYLDAHGGH